MPDQAEHDRDFGAFLDSGSCCNDGEKEEGWTCCERATPTEGSQEE